MKSLIKIERGNVVPFIVSALFHPIFTPLLGVCFILSSHTYQMMIPENNRFYICLIVLGFTVVVPLLLLPLFYFFRVVRSIEMSERAERIVPLMLTILSYYATYSFFKHNHLLIFINLYLLAVMMASITALIVNLFWKISLHAIGWGGLMALSLFMAMVGYLPSLWLLFLVIFIVGATATARLYMQIHTPAQIYVGLLVGFVWVAFSLIFLSNFLI